MFKTICKQMLKKCGIGIYRLPSARSYVYDEEGLRTTCNHDFVSDSNFIKAFHESQLTPFLIEHRGSGHGRWNLHVVLWAANRAIKMKTDIVQLGVFEGSEARAIASYTEIGKHPDIRMVLVDTFTGVPEEKWADAEIAAGANSAQWAYKNAGNTYECVRTAMAKFSNVEIIKGTVPEVLPEISSKRIGLLLLDLNCAQPERAAAEFLWDRVVEGGIVISDDYGHSRKGVGFYAQKLAFDEFAKSKGVEVLSLPTGHGLIIK